MRLIIIKILSFISVAALTLGGCGEVNESPTKTIISIPKLPDLKYLATGVPKVVGPTKVSLSRVPVILPKSPKRTLTKKKKVAKERVAKKQKKTETPKMLAKASSPLSIKNPIQHYGFTVSLPTIALNLNEIKNAPEFKYAAKSTQPIPVEPTKQRPVVTQKGYNPSDPKLLEQFDKVPKLVDMVTTAKAALARPKVTPSTALPSRINDDMTFTDLRPKEEKGINSGDVDSLASLAGSPVSSRVNDALTRIMGTQAAGVNRQPLPKSNVAKKLKVALSPPKGIEIVPFGLDIQKGEELGNQYSDLELTPDHDSNALIYPNTDGVIEVPVSKNSQTLSFDGVLSGRDIVNTRLSIQVEDPNSIHSLPLIERKGLVEFLDTQEVDGIGGLVWVDLGEELQDVTLDTDTEARFYFTDNYKLVESINDARFVFFVGVPQGNVLAKYLGTKGQIAEKIILVQENVITVEIPELIKDELEFETFMKHSMGQVNDPLNLAAEQINFLQGGAKINQESPNGFSVNNHWRVKGNKSFLKVDFDNKEFFFGSYRKKDLELPSQTVIEEILDTFERESLDGRCLVQFDFPYDIHDFSIETKDGFEHFYHQAYFQDETGRFSDQPNSLSRRLFVLGEGMGRVAISLRDSKGELHYLYTPCSPNDFFIEKH